MSFWEDDLDAFFSDFAVTATWKGIEIKAIFHNEYEPTTLFAAEIESKDPFVEVKSADIEGAAHGDSFEVNETEYEIIGIKPDGTGITVLILKG